MHSSSSRGDAPAKGRSSRPQTSAGGGGGGGGVGEVFSTMSENGCAVISLNRPRKKNAMSLGMLLDISKAVVESVLGRAKAIVIRSATKGMFCSGGDMVELTSFPVYPEWYFMYTEFRLDNLIHSLDTPLVTLLDGVCMGGGCGIGMHLREGSFRVATENTVLAMPETKSGWFPDCGADHFFRELPDGWGQYLALTGNSIDYRACAALGLSTHVIESKRLTSVMKALSTADLSDGAITIDWLLGGFEMAFEPDPAFAALDVLVRRCFSSAFSVEEVVERLRDFGTAQSLQIREDLLQRRSPLSLKVALSSYNRSLHRDLSHGDIMRHSFRLARRLMPDFREGVKALLKDKSYAPNYRFAELAEISPEDVDECFSPEGMPEGAGQRLPGFPARAPEPLPLIEFGGDEELAELAALFATQRKAYANPLPAKSAL